MVRVAIIGCGGIGSRHLQGAAKSPEVSHIDCIEISEDNIKLSKERLGEIQHNKRVNFYKQVSDLEGAVDICIIATPSKVRKKIIFDILKSVKVKYFILEKVVVQKEEDFESVIKFFDSHSIGCWVNCYSRAEERYKIIKNNVIDSKKLEVEAIYPNPPNFNLASSAVHILDLFCYLRDNYELELDLGGLEENIFDSKHAGYIEFKGTMRIKNALGDTMIVRPSDVSALVYILKAGDLEYTCSEDEDSFVATTPGSRNTIESEFLWQNSLTNLYIRDILETGSCDLPTLGESFEVHEVFLSGIRKRFDIEVANIT